MGDKSKLIINEFVRPDSIPKFIRIDNGNIINTYQSIREAARQLGNIKKDSNIINGIKTHQKRYGYYWKYASV